MKRRGFLATMFGAIFAPKVVKPETHAIWYPSTSVDLEIVSTPVVANARKLKVRWSEGAQLDLERWYKIAPEQPLPPMFGPSKG